MEDEEREELREDEEEAVEGEVLPAISTFRDTSHRRPEVVMVETGRGMAVQAQVGVPFESTIDAIAERANYGGDYRVFINGSEILSPTEIPLDASGQPNIQAGQRIAITAYDKPGAMTCWSVEERILKYWSKPFYTYQRDLLR